MGLLDQVLRSALSQGRLSNPLMLALLALLASGALFGGGNRQAAPTKPGGRPSEDEGLLEGLGGLLDRFRQSGQAKTIDSWIGTGPNEPFRPVSWETRSGRTFSRRLPSGLACRRMNCSSSCRRLCRTWSIN